MIFLSTSNLHSIAFLTRNLRYHRRRGRTIQHKIDRRSQWIIIYTNVVQSVSSGPKTLKPKLENDFTVKTEFTNIKLIIQQTLRTFHAQSTAATPCAILTGTCHSRCTCNLQARTQSESKTLPFIPSLNLESPLQQQLVARCADFHTPHAPLDSPGIIKLAPIRHRILVEHNVYLFGLPWCEIPGLRKSFKLEKRVSEVGCGWGGDVHLHDFGAGNIAGVGHIQRDSEREFGTNYGWLGEREVFQIERRV